VSLVPEPLFREEADAALDVFDELRVVDVAGSPKMGEVARPWIREFVAAVFGAYDPQTYRRLIREHFMLIAKKNGKSTTAAGIMLTALLLNWRQSAEMGILAPTVEVANNAYAPARDMIKADEELSALLMVQDHIRTITHRETGAKLQVVAADSETVAGKKWTFTLVDELWLFGKRPNAGKMLLEATGGMASRPEGFVLYLSTQSDEAPAGVFKEKLDYARAVRDGRIEDPEFLPVIYEFPPDMVASKAYRDEANWRITNPNLGASVDPAYIRRKLREAGEGTAGTLQDVLAKHLNVEIGLALMSNRWAGADYWERQGTHGLTLDEVIRRSEVLTVGLDGGGLDDLFGLSVVGRDAQTRDWLVWSHAWAHPQVLERRKSEAARFRDFEKDGDLTIVGAIGEDIAEVVGVVVRCDASRKLDKVGVDPVGIGAVVDALVDAGIEQDRIVGISQGWKMAGAIKTAERKLAEGTMWHGAAPLMAWCAGNAKVEPKGNAIAITKQAAGFAKIDPLMALFNAVSLMSLNPSPARSPVLAFG
jgi:phage terminase large subunit-like protein